MKKIKELLLMLEKNRETAYSLVRIYLGIALFVRGIILFAEPEAITKLAGAHDMYMWHSYIIGAHIIGGLLLALGLLTRVAALFQIPILFGAVFFIHIEQGLITGGQSLELAGLVLVLLFIYLLFGSGKFSLDTKIWHSGSPA
ncbi:MAG: DoxX family membrane protein [Ignavibacteriae bacterium]|nr:DoxX family membrane protein [Ignavibacteriota bacterium]NOG99491.1 DoxX family membrane protein [Ignavibacteriota bacterium]